jgi:hypothetical protein
MTNAATPVPAAKPASLPNITSGRDLTHLHEYNKKFLGDEHFHASAAALGESFFLSLSSMSVSNDKGACSSQLYNTTPTAVAWRATLPSKHHLLRRTPFGQPDLLHSFTVEPGLEHCVNLIYKSGFLNITDLITVCTSHSLYLHLASAMVHYRFYDFRWISQYDPDWATQTTISPVKQAAMMACLLHYDLNTSLLMRYLGNNYTGAYRHTSDVVATLTRCQVPTDLITKYIRVMTTGCPAKFVAESTRVNALLHWRMLNHTSIDNKLAQVAVTMNKEDRNNYVIPLPHWLARFIPHLFITPQHILERPGKKDRQIFDASRRYTWDSVPINHMTSTPHGSEEPCLFGNVMQRVLHRIYSLRSHYGPALDIILHANDVKSAFRQVKLHPDIMGAFSYIIADKLFLSCGQPFGTDFSPANWEVVRQVLEHLATQLYHDTSLRQKHRHFLDNLQWDRSLHSRSGRIRLTRAAWDALNTSVVDTVGDPLPTPHFVYVDDDIYVDIYSTDDYEQCIAASIEAIYILLGPSDLAKRQDPISFDKLQEMIIGPINRILGHIVDTRRMTIAPPPDFMSELSKSLSTTWASHRKSFRLREIEILVGKLNHVAIGAPWLKFLMGQLYVSIASALRVSEAHLISSSAAFREVVRALHAPPPPGAHTGTYVSFFAGDKSRRIHHSTRLFHINRTLRAELQLVHKALLLPPAYLSSPIAHLVPRTPIAIVRGDSSLDAAGGYSSALGFWWYLEWPPAVRLRTLRYIKNNKANTLISINALEYATILISYLAAYHSLATPSTTDDPFPVVRIESDNTTSEAWSRKGCKDSMCGRALSRIHSSLLLGTHVGLHIARISTSDNVIADRLSRIPSVSHLPAAVHSICQDHAALRGCRQFQPNAELISAIMGALLEHASPHPVALSRRLLTSPGCFTSLPGASA